MARLKFQMIRHLKNVPARIWLMLAIWARVNFDLR
jgi:hypothetical protein